MPEMMLSSIAPHRHRSPREGMATIPHRGGQSRINRVPAATSASILYFPTSLAWMIMLCEAAIVLSPVIASSRPTMRTTIQAGARRTCTKEMRAVEMSSLSAIGASKFPSVVPCWGLPALFPSSQSVKTAAKKITAAVIFFAAVLTDWLDGKSAGSPQQGTTLGNLLAPIADKLLISTALISLVQVRRAPAWMVVLIVGRELAITGLRTIAASQSIIIHASDVGKYKMLAEGAAGTLLILDWPPRRGIVAIPSLGLLCLWGAMLLSIISGIDYFLRFWKVIDLNR